MTMMKSAADPHGSSSWQSLRSFESVVLVPAAPSHVWIVPSVVDSFLAKHYVPASTICSNCPVMSDITLQRPSQIRLNLQIIQSVLSLGVRVN